MSFFVSALAEEDTASTSSDEVTILFEPAITATFDLSVFEWFDDEYTRALFLILFLCDMSSNYEFEYDAADAVCNPSYVFLADTSTIGVVLTFPDEGEAILAMYQPDTNHAEWIAVNCDVGEEAMEMIMESALSESEFLSFYKNDTETILEVLNVIDEYIS